MHLTWFFLKPLEFEGLKIGAITHLICNGYIGLLYIDFCHEQAEMPAPICPAEFFAVPPEEIAALLKFLVSRWQESSSC